MNFFGKRKPERLCNFCKRPAEVDHVGCADLGWKLEAAEAEVASLKAKYDEADLRWALGQLRHLYRLMIDGCVRDPASTARGLLGPAIERLEKALEK